jgi:imidazole glycerol-phosphate synthase subunit HisF
VSKRRIIPKIALRESPRLSKTVAVTTVEFRDTLEVGDPVSQARVYESQVADELFFIDLDATSNGRRVSSKIIEAVSEELFMPITVGGGIRSLEDVRDLLSHGADKVSIGTAALSEPDLISKIAERFGSQCVMVSIDYRRDGSGSSVWSQSGTLRTAWNVVGWAREAERRGAGEILLNSIDRDGKRNGIDLEITKAVVESVTIPVVTSGGCGLAQHFVDAFLNTGVSAVAAGTYFSFKDENPLQLRARVKNSGVRIRTT